MLVILVAISSCAHQKIRFSKKRDLVKSEHFIEKSEPIAIQSDANVDEFVFTIPAAETVLIGTNHQQLRTEINDFFTPLKNIDFRTITKRLDKKASQKSKAKSYSLRGRYVNPDIFLGIGVVLLVFGILLLLAAGISVWLGSISDIPNIGSSASSNGCANSSVGCVMAIIIIVVLILFMLLVEFVFGYINSIYLSLICIGVGLLFLLIGAIIYAR